MNLRPRKRTSPVIPIVAMVDILVIVLLFIVATTTWRKKEKDPPLPVQINLPQSSTLGDGTKAPEARRTLSITKDNEIFLNGEKVEPADLTQALKEIKLLDPNAKLDLNADEVTHLGVLVRIWDSLKAADFAISDAPFRVQRAKAP